MPSVASATFSPDVTIKGLVGSPRSFTRDDLMQLPAETVNVSFQAGQGTTQASFTGTRLLSVFDAAGGAKLPTDGNNAKLRVTVMVTGTDGYQVALGWGELDPEFGSAPILLAYSQDEKPMGDKQGMARLVVPGDKRGGATCRPSRASKFAIRAPRNRNPAARIRARRSTGLVDRRCGTVESAGVASSLHNRPAPRLRLRG